MKYGIFGINIGACARPEVGARVARAAEEAGFESVWTGEHVVLPDPQVPPSPVPPGVPFLDPAVSLAFLAAHTETIRLATGIIILPQRNPLVLAKELASVDVVSGGRLVFGIGVGYLKPEFDALGISFERKGARTDDYLRAILAVWTQEKPHYRGEFVSFAGIDAQPRPVQKPHPPIVIGGGTPAAFRRAVRSGNGWYGFNVDLEGAKRAVAALGEAAEKVERPASLGDLEITVSPPAGFPLEDVPRFAEAGVDRVALLNFVGTESELLGFVERASKALIR